MFNASQFWKRGSWISSRPRNAGEIFMDSGGFVFFNKFGEYPFSVDQYLGLIHKMRPDYFASMDFPCEPTITSLLGKIGVKERIERTVENAVRIAQREGETKALFVPVIQGYDADDYAYCLELHRQAGTIRPYMAVGSLCNRSNSQEIGDLFPKIYESAQEVGVKQLHAFGLKRSPKLSSINHLIYSRDSATLYYTNSNEKRREWEKSKGGRSTRFAPTRQDKKDIIASKLKDLSAEGYIWSV